MKRNFTITIICTQGCPLIVYLMELDMAITGKKNKKIYFCLCKRNHFSMILHSGWMNLLMFSIRSQSLLRVFFFYRFGWTVLGEQFWVNGFGKQRDCYKEFLMWKFSTSLWLYAPGGTWGHFWPILYRGCAI